MDTDGKRRQSSQPQNAYYHDPNFDCVRRNHSWAEASNTFVHN